jgi:DNA invertase Pin-like site-specific DNA recombinase
MDRQLKDCRALAIPNGWVRLQEFVDNDISAPKYSRKRRPAYRDMLERVGSDEVTRIVCQHIDRLYRVTSWLLNGTGMVTGYQTLSKTCGAANGCSDNWFPSRLGEL